jgi:hypothetical protein
MTSFDEFLDRRGTHCYKWDMLEEVCGVSPEDGIAMGVADSDFRNAPPILDALQGDGRSRDLRLRLRRSGASATRFAGGNRRATAGPSIPTGSSSRRASGMRSG